MYFVSYSVIADDFIVATENLFHYCYLEE